MNVDMSQTIIPRSDQLNAEDLLSGPRTVTITEVRRGSAEQPVDIHLAEFDRPFKPSKTVRRILVAAWGVDAASYVGRRMTIYRDPTVKFGGMDVGGIRISHLSHIDKQMRVALTVTRGKRAPYVVEPLATPAARQPEPAADAPAEKLLTQRQSRELQALLKDTGRADAAVALTHIGFLIGHEISHTKELTATEADAVIHELTVERDEANVPAQTGKAVEPNFDDEAWLAGQSGGES